MSGTGDGRAAWLTDQGSNTTYQEKRDPGAAYGETVTGDPRAAFIGHTGEVQQIPHEQKVVGDYHEDETTVGDPRRAAFAAGHDTTAAGRHHEPVNTGIHSVGTGDPRAAWASNAAVDPIDVQEERDIRRAIAASLADQKQGGSTTAGSAISGDPRANWLQSDTAHGGRHNWEKPTETPPPGDIKDPRAF